MWIELCTFYISKLEFLYVTFSPSIIREITNTKFQEIYQVGSSTHLKNFKRELSVFNTKELVRSFLLLTYILIINYDKTNSTFRTNSFRHTDDDILNIFNHFNNNRLKYTFRTNPFSCIKLINYDFSHIYKHL